MELDSYFPTGIVTGIGFCDRENERELLKNRLSQNAHVVLISPRRYGKSSLIAQFTLEQNLPVASVDLLPAISSTYIQNTILDGVGILLERILPTSRKIKDNILRLFSTMHPVIELSALGQKIKLSPHDKSPQEVIMKVLLNLDKAAQEVNKKVIFVMDEFQQICNLEEAYSLEASIRHAVERSKNVFYVFSGSNRTLLEAMFKNKERPLYHLCDEIKIHRIDRDHYFRFVKKAAKARWKMQMVDETLDMILALTECHPYYLNRLCRTLWDKKTMPDSETVRQTWDSYVQMQITDWVADIISKMSVNQRKILAAIAKEPEKQPQNKAFSSKLVMTGSSIQRALYTLLKEDLLYVDNVGYYRVLNPVIRSYLAANRYL